jgi:alpha-L-fucosidase
MDWFLRAKFGIFLHWGIYSAGGIEASWPFFHAQVPHDWYFGLAKKFGAERYDPRAWARFFREIGATYAVLTTKHHDGVALWPTEQSRALRAVDISPAGKRWGDLVGPFCEALRAEGLKVGLYFSHADWSHPDYASVHNAGAPAESASAVNAKYSYPPGKDEPERWERFIAFHRGQLKELCTWYSPDLLWFDGDWERSGEQWRAAELRELLKGWRPGVIHNNRLSGLGDYLTFELKMAEKPMTVPWEVAETLNHQWAWSPDNSTLKSVETLAWVYRETTRPRAGGVAGNLLLNIGPRADGTFDPLQGRRLAELGEWIHGAGAYV